MLSIFRKQNANIETSQSNAEAHSSSNHQHNREKRHSFNSLTTPHHSLNTNRYSAEILSPEGEGKAQTQKYTNILDRHKRSGDTLTVNMVQLPAPYVALYPYKPQKSDELELRKGGIYMVTERCQDGWFKGTSNRTQKCGVFPGNYVTLAQNVSRSPIASPRANENLSDTKSVGGSRLGKPMFPLKQNTNNLPPELPPRSSSPALVTNTISSSWHGQQESTTLPLGRSTSTIMTGASATQPPIGTTSVIKTSDKVCYIFLSLLFLVAFTFIFILFCYFYVLFC